MSVFFSKLPRVLMWVFRVVVTNFFQNSLEECLAIDSSGYKAGRACVRIVVDLLVAVVSCLLNQ